MRINRITDHTFSLVDGWFKVLSLYAQAEKHSLLPNTQCHLQSPAVEWDVRVLARCPRLQEECQQGQRAVLVDWGEWRWTFKLTIFTSKLVFENVILKLYYIVFNKYVQSKCMMHRIDSICMHMYAYVCVCFCVFLCVCLCSSEQWKTGNTNIKQADCVDCNLQWNKY